MMSVKANRWIGAVPLLLLVACGPSEPAAPSGPVVTTVDGVRVVENTAPAWAEGEAWHLSAEPVLTLGVDLGDPEQMFANMRRPVQLSDGRIVVADSSNQLRYFDAAGGHLFTTGGSGQGPGEFTTIGNPLRTPSDGLLIDNLNAGNMLAFDGDGNYQTTFQPEGHGMNYVRARVIGVFGDGSLLARGSDRPGSVQIPAGEIGWRRLALFRYLADGTQPHMLGEFPFTEVSGGEGQLKFPARGVFATSEDGFYVSDGRRAEIEAYDLEGRLGQRIRWPAEVVEVSNAAKEEYYSISRANIEAYGGDARAEQRMLEVVFAPTVPLLAAMMVDDEGNLWAMRHAGHAFPVFYPGQESRFEPQPSYWEVFTPEGTWLGTFEFPPGMAPAQVGADYVLAGGQDDAGVERIRKYRLIKP